MSLQERKAEKDRAERDIDCDICRHRKDCERAQSHSFCPRFSKKEPPDRGESPADAWARGEDSL